MSVDNAQVKFLDNPNYGTAADLIDEALEAESAGDLTDDEFRDVLVLIRDWLAGEAR